MNIFDIQIYFSFFVPLAGVEPTQPLGLSVPKTDVSTISPQGLKIFQKTILQSLCQS